tara:strand:- start:197 stop:781 length:585 start_codon:yes stop_codon:yes gene_type:complete
MPNKGVEVIEERLMTMLGKTVSTEFTCSLAHAFDGPYHYLPGENIWEVGEKDCFVWFIQSGFGFDRILLEDGHKMLNGMSEPGIFICDEKSLLWGGPSVSDSIVSTPTTAYRVPFREFREFLSQNEEFRENLAQINAYFVHMRKLRLLKMKHMNKADYWVDIKERFPGIELYCTQTEIANYFAVSKSTMHRLMR